MTRHRNHPFGNAFAGFLPYEHKGDIDSAPLTEKIRSAIVAKYEIEFLNVMFKLIHIRSRYCKSSLMEDLTANRITN